MKAHALYLVAGVAAIVGGVVAVLTGHRSGVLGLVAGAGFIALSVIDARSHRRTLNESTNTRNG